jgi:hypothetical protein
MNLFGGTFYQCSDTYGLSYEFLEENVKTKWDCLNYGGEWINKDNNFDTVLNSMSTLIGVQSTEGWVQVMWDSVDATKPDLVPVAGNNKVYVVLYICLIVTLVLLFMNLFVGIIMQSFNDEKNVLDMN